MWSAEAQTSMCCEMGCTVLFRTRPRPCSRPLLDGDPGLSSTTHGFEPSQRWAVHLWLWSVWPFQFSSTSSRSYLMVKLCRCVAAVGSLLLVWFRHETQQRHQWRTQWITSVLL
ncbi:hypothetical protein VTI74DRAFT_7057 [Chaetomium olivicolor]